MIESVIFVYVFFQSIIHSSLLTDVQKVCIRAENFQWKFDLEDKSLYEMKGIKTILDSQRFGYFGLRTFWHHDNSTPHGVFFYTVAFNLCSL